MEAMFGMHVWPTIPSGVLASREVRLALKIWTLIPQGLVLPAISTATWLVSLTAVHVPPGSRGS